LSNAFELRGKHKFQIDWKRERIEEAYSTIGGSTNQESLII
jgi:hypothetical protein